MFHSNFQLIRLFILIFFFNVCMIFICFDSLDRNLHVVTVLNKSAPIRVSSLVLCACVVSLLYVMILSFYFEVNLLVCMCGCNLQLFNLEICIQ